MMPMILVISGQPGAGKSTVCLRIFDEAIRRGISCGGVITTKSEDAGIVIRDAAIGEERTLAERDKPTGGPQAGRYHFRLEAITFGIEAIMRGDVADLLFVDELGHLEIWDGGFVAAIPLLNHREKSSVVVIREELLDALLPRFTRPPLVVYTSLENRDELPAHVIGQLFPGLED